MSIQEVFKTLLQGKGLSKEQIDQATKEFTAVAVLTIATAGKDKLNQDESALVQSSLSKGDGESALVVLKSKYSDYDWEQMLQSELASLAESYYQEVVNQK